MIEIRKAGERGHFNFGWLDTWHSFSFGHYRDPKQQGFSDLLVINDDVVQPGMGFGTHPHRDMEIFTYILSGALEGLPDVDFILLAHHRRAAGARRRRP